MHSILGEAHVELLRCSTRRQAHVEEPLREMRNCRREVLRRGPLKQVMWLVPNIGVPFVYPKL